MIRTPSQLATSTGARVSSIAFTPGYRYISALRSAPSGTARIMHQGGNGPIRQAFAVDGLAIPSAPITVVPDLADVNNPYASFNYAAWPVGFGIATLTPVGGATSSRPEIRVWAASFVEVTGPDGPIQLKGYDTYILSGPPHAIYACVHLPRIDGAFTLVVVPGPILGLGAGRPTIML